MGFLAWKAYFAVRALIDRDEGQDMVEYALVMSLVALGCVAGMDALGQVINTIYLGLKNKLPFL